MKNLREIAPAGRGSSPAAPAAAAGAISAPRSTGADGCWRRGFWRRGFWTSSPGSPGARELTISPLILPWWYQIPTQCKRPKVLLVHALPRGHLSSSPDALLPILSSRPPQLCQLRHARLLPPPTGDSIQTLRLRWPCPQTLRAAERVDVQRSARALNRSPHYAEPCRLRPLVRLAFDPLTVMWFPPAGRWR